MSISKRILDVTRKAVQRVYKTFEAYLSTVDSVVRGLLGVPEEFVDIIDKIVGIFPIYFEDTVQMFHEALLKFRLVIETVLSTTDEVIRSLMGYLKEATETLDRIIGVLVERLSDTVSLVPELIRKFRLIIQTSVSTLDEAIRSLMGKVGDITETNDRIAGTLIERLKDTVSLVPKIVLTLHQYIRTSISVLDSFIRSLSGSVSDRDSTKDRLKGLLKERIYSYFNDNFNDATIGSEWETVTDNGGSVSETGGDLQVTIPSGSDVAIAGIVSKKKYNYKNGYLKVDVNDGDELKEMWLYIGLTKVTQGDPFFEQNWYRAGRTKYGTNDFYVQKKVNDTLYTLHTNASTQTGTIKIVISGNTIKFYDGNTLKYSETYALSSYQVFVYLFTSSTREDYTGTDSFDNFESKYLIDTATINRCNLIRETCSSYSYCTCDDQCSCESVCDCESVGSCSDYTVCSCDSDYCTCVSEPCDYCSCNTYTCVCEVE